VLEHGMIVAEIPNAALTDDAPVYKRLAGGWEPPSIARSPHVHFAIALTLPRQLSGCSQAQHLLERGCGSQYEPMVQTNTVKRRSGRCWRDSHQRLQAGSPWRSMAMALVLFDPRLGAMHAVAGAARKWLARERLRSALLTAQLR